MEVDVINACNGLALRKISGTRKDAYLKKIDFVEAVFIIGETALKATGEIDFPMPVIIIDGLSETAARGPVFRIITSDFETTDENAISVSKVEDFNLAKKDMAAGKEIILKCQGISAAELINKLLADMKKIREE